MENPENAFNNFEDSRIIKKTKQVLEQFCVVDYLFAAQEDGSVLFTIKYPEEHLEERKKQYESLMGYLEPTEFIKNKMIPIMNEIKAIKDLDCRPEPSNDKSVTILKVFKDKWKATPSRKR